MPASQIYEGMVVLTNAEFKAVPTAPFTLVPATEVLGYVGAPSAIPLNIQATIVIDNRAGAYVAANDAALVIGMGSDWSTNLTQESTPNGLTNAGVQVVSLCPRMQASVPSTPSLAEMSGMNTNLDGQVQDNAIVLAASNEGVDFTGGHEDNKVWVIFSFQLLSLT